MFNLFWVFSHLSKKQIGPFNLGRVEYCPPEPPLDWSRLPAELQYLGKFAEKSGKYWGDAVDEFIGSGSEEDKEELAALSERIRLNGHVTAVYAWVKQHYGVKHPEATMVAEMLNLMDEAGVPIED